MHSNPNSPELKMSLIRTVKVIVKLPGNKTETLTESIPGEWVAGDKDALSEVLENPKIRTKIAVVQEHVISAQISDPWDPTNAGGFRVVRG
jgi:hypothetical protein